MPAPARVPSAPSEPAEATPFPPAPLSRRVAARALDLLVLLVVFVAVGWALQRVFFPGVVLQGQPSGPELTFLRVVTVVDAVIALLYETVGLRWRGRTPAKAALGLRVVDARSGRRPGWGAAAGRAVVLLGPAFLPVVGLYWPLLVAAPLFFDPLRRGLHDRAARTAVVGG